MSKHSTLTVRTMSGGVSTFDLKNPSTCNIKPRDDTVVITTTKSLSGDSRTDKRTGTICARTTGFNWYDIIPTIWIEKRKMKKDKEREK